MSVSLCTTLLAGLEHGILTVSGSVNLSTENSAMSEQLEYIVRELLHHMRLMHINYELVCQLLLTRISITVFLFCKDITLLHHSGGNFSVIPDIFPVQFPPNSYQTKI